MVIFTNLDATSTALLRIKISPDHRYITHCEHWEGDKGA